MLSSSLTLGARLTLVGGKGGVGKTTVAAALAVELADAGDAVTAISVDPAHSLGDALGLALGPNPVPHPDLLTLHALEVDPEVERRRFLQANGPHLDALIERGTYLEAADLQPAEDLALPGIDELAGFLALARLIADPARRVIVDTAPTGHTLRLLELPRIALSWIAALEAMEAKHAAVAGALAGRYAPDAAARFLGTLRAEFEEVGRTLRDPHATRFVLVTSAASVVLAETLRFHDRLEELGVAPGGIVVNRHAGGAAPDARGGGMVFLPELSGLLEGVDGMRRVAAAADAAGGQAPTAKPDPPAHDRPRLGASWAPPVDRYLTIVGGKGGVGKTTVAAALAVRLAREGERCVLLLSVDPAGSLAEVLGCEVAGEPGAVPEVPGLEARQLDATQAWERFRARYREEIEQLFAGPGPATGATLDRQVAERVLELAPPGIDELVGMLEVIDLSEDRAYDAIVVDTAPTGHLLRLLAMPGLALDWVHALLRLLLKYRDVIGLSGVGERVLELARRIRRLQDELHDPSRASLLVVALPESLSIAETARLLPRVRELGIPLAGLLVNRAFHGEVVEHLERVEALIDLGQGIPTAAAPALEDEPVGGRALERFATSWRQLRRGAASAPDPAGPPGKGSGGDGSGGVNPPE